MVRRVLGDAMRSLHVSEACISDVLLAVSEACSNAVRHGGPANRYEVSASIGFGQCDVRISDNGHGIPAMPRQFPPPETENGRGLLIMRSVVDEMTFGSTPAGTTVHLRKQLEWDNVPELAAV
ncbi:MAG: ATP-binding protein [Nonomuraea sp.]|nr:ATP-binding protein [Nonomuraea sp.]